MISALRRAAMRAILRFHNCEGQSHKTVSTNHNLWWERRADADFNRRPSAYQPNDLPLNRYATKGALFISAQLSTDAVSALRKVWVLIQLQALVYDILPSTTAVFSYAIGSRELSANEQFFVVCSNSIVVSLLQTAEIKQGVSFMAANKVYTNTNKTTIVWIETELFLSPAVDASHVYVRAFALGCFYSHISTGTFQRALTASMDSCAEIKSAPSVAY